MTARFAAAFALFCTLLSMSTPVMAEGSTAGQFDFYVLSLSWSPSYCETVGDKRKEPQCARPFGFVVHGLWPQFEKGYPSDCADASGRLPDSLIKAQLDIFPAAGLVVHEWKKHGSCTGLDPAAFFDAARKAYSGIAIPAALSHIDKPQYIDPGEIAKDFETSNKGLDATELAVVCNKRGLEEVRICLNKDLKTFHPCPQVVAGSCKLDKAYLPAMRAAN
jgi:ribonuclease T2